MSQTKSGPLDLSSATRFTRVSHWITPTIRELAERCMDLQQESLAHRGQAVADPEVARAAVSEAALKQILQAGDDIHGISLQPGISQVRVYDRAPAGVDPILDRLFACKRDLDQAVDRMLRDNTRSHSPLQIEESGHFWYPRGCHMGWHTNNRVPGWRCYLSYAREPGKSFFRYRDPDTEEIVTSEDTGWDLRLFQVDPGSPLWHSVYSDTDRFSYGYILFTPTRFRAALRKVKRLLSG